jgi:hypothetical protein
VVVSKGNHFPMCDDPDLVAAAIRSLHRDGVAPKMSRKFQSSGLASRKENPK